MGLLLDDRSSAWGSAHCDGCHSSLGDGLGTLRRVSTGAHALLDLLSTFLSDDETLGAVFDLIIAIIVLSRSNGRIFLDKGCS